MRRYTHVLAVHLALSAMVLRALLPAGWMPSSSSSPTFILTICTMEGPLHLNIEGHSKDQPTHSSDHDGCPFAAAPHVATPLLTITPSQSFLVESAHFKARPITQAADIASYSPQVPRAPPVLV